MNYFVLSRQGIGTQVGDVLTRLGTVAQAAGEYIWRIC